MKSETAGKEEERMANDNVLGSHRFDQLIRRMETLKIIYLVQQPANMAAH